MASNESLARLTFTKPVKWIVVHKNGDNQAHGRRVIIKPREIRTFDKLLEEVTNKLAPSFGAVRNIFTPDNGSRVTQLALLENEKRYVVAGGDQFRRLHRARYADLPVYLSNRSLLSLRPLNRDQLAASSVDAAGGRLIRPELSRVTETCVRVIRNGDAVGQPLMMRLAGDDLANYDLVMSRVAGKLRTNVDKLFDTAGRVVENPASDLVFNAVYAAATASEKFQPSTFRRGNVRDSLRNKSDVPAKVNASSLLSPVKTNRNSAISSDQNGHKGNIQHSVQPQKQYSQQQQLKLPTSPRFVRKPSQSSLQSSAQKRLAKNQRSTSEDKRRPISDRPHAASTGNASPHSRHERMERGRNRRIIRRGSVSPRPARDSDKRSTGDQEVSATKQPSRPAERKPRHRSRVKSKNIEGRSPGSPAVQIKPQSEIKLAELVTDPVTDEHAPSPKKPTFSKYTGSSRKRKPTKVGNKSMDGSSSISGHEVGVIQNSTDVSRQYSSPGTQSLSEELKLSENTSLAMNQASTSGRTTQHKVNEKHKQVAQLPPSESPVQLTDRSTKLLQKTSSNQTFDKTGEEIGNEKAYSPPSDTQLKSRRDMGNSEQLSNNEANISDNRSADINKSPENRTSMRPFSQNQSARRQMRLVQVGTDRDRSHIHISPDHAAEIASEVDDDSHVDVEVPVDLQPDQEVEEDIQ